MDRMKIILLFCLVSCGKPVVSVPLGSCISMVNFSCIDFSDITDKHVLTSDSVRFICAGVYGDYYGIPNCASVMKSKSSGACALKPADGVEEVFNFYPPVTADEAFNACQKVQGTFEAP